MNGQGREKVARAHDNPVCFRHMNGAFCMSILDVYSILCRLRGNGNANYLYFQSLVFAGFQGALGCGLLIAAVKRHDQTRDGERCAQVNGCSCYSCFVEKK